MLVRDPSGRGVEPITQRPQDRAVDHVQGIRDAAKILAEARLEEALEPADARRRQHQQRRGPEEIEGLVVEDGLGRQEGQEIPSTSPSELVDVTVERGYTTEKEA